MLDSALEITNGPDADSGQLGKLLLGESSLPPVASKELPESLRRSLVGCQAHPGLPSHHGADRFADSGADFAWSLLAASLIVRGVPAYFNAVPAACLSRTT
jgi:hypothetical protein